MQELRLGEDEVLNCGIVVLNAKVAQALLNSTLFPRQRLLNEQNVDRLQGELERGHYIPGTPLYFAVLPSNDMYLLNGRHSLTALSRARVDKQSLTVPFTAIMYRVKDIEQAGHIYSRLDVHRSRTWNDAFRAAGFHESDQFKNGAFNAGWISTFGGAVRTTLRSFRVDNPIELSSLLASREMQLRLFQDYLPHGEAFIAALAHRNGPGANPWRRSGVMSIGMELMKHQPKKAMEFLRGASADDGLRQTDPRKALLTWLRNAKSQSRDQRNMTASAVALAWNHFYSNETLTNLYPSSRGQIVLDGTPWNGNYDPVKSIAMKSFKAAINTYAVDYDLFTTGQMTDGTGEIIPVAYAMPLKATHQSESRSVN